MFKNKSFVIKMVKDSDVPEDPPVEVNVDEIISKVIVAGVFLMGSWITMDTARQIVVGKTLASKT